MTSDEQRPSRHSRRIVILTGSVGGGHDGAAYELQRRLTERGFRAEVHDYLDFLPRKVGSFMRDNYERSIRVAPFTWGVVNEVSGRRPLSSVLRAMSSALARRDTRRTVRPSLAEAAGPAAVVSTYPLASQALGRLRRSGRLQAPVITFLTDMSVHPLWIAKGVDFHLALHEVAAEAARKRGAKGVHVCGPAVPPAFHPVSSVDEKLAARKKFDLPLDEPLVALVGGAGGMGDVRKAARDIAQTGLARPVVVCGKNEATRAAIEEEGHAIALGWVTEMPTLLRACDVAIQNAGGLSSLEALATGIPVLTYRSITGHGRDNSAALDESGWIRWVKHKRDLPEALRAALSGIPNTAARAASHPPVDPADTIAELASQEVEPMGRRRIVRRLRLTG
ncbi:MGDG synthase family glycosyltransferase [Fodinicola acaciae]|uniref:MGDG synthase family glycosyltransferase n=1 Tax=Fodinicola acaciae TaxID=2681555 RepID=UPI0013D76DA1|nr:hypothetical protein [Fodinicola acaciae]